MISRSGPPVGPPATPPPTNLEAGFASRVLIAGALVIGLLLLVLLLWYAVYALLLTFAGVLLAILLRGLSDELAQRTQLSEGWALAVVVFGLLLLVTAIGVFTAPQINQQFQQLQQRTPEIIEELRGWLEQYALGRWVINLIPTQNNLEFGPFLQQATGLAFTAMHVFFGILVLLFVTLYLAVNPRLYTNGILHLVPFRHRPKAAEVLAAIGSTLRWWLIGTVVRMIAVGAMTYAGLWLLDVPLALLLSIVAFLLDFVPYFGPIIAAVPAVAIAFVESPQLAIYVVVVYIVVQQVESLIISPLIYQRTIYMPPVVTILAQVLLFAMVGALGIILAMPLTAVVLVLVKTLYLEETLGDRELHDAGEQGYIHIPGGREAERQARESERQPAENPPKAGGGES